ncbi:MAG: hypothetical protein SWO11_14315 [Thermodesulfobacteriota bacterium]|nr:hypothetical protein [Thermodesulfobacteriota bacterium]
MSSNQKDNCEHDGIKLVEKIPGDLVGTKEIKLKVKSYAGYASKNGNNLFCWFFEAQKCLEPDKAGDFPLLIWLNGGPGASSMAGCLLENSPYLIQANEAGTVAENPYAWNKETHIMYWDNPVDSEDELSDQFYEALQVFFKTFPVYRSCPLFITGESYGGKYIPAISEKIMERNQELRDKKDEAKIINLKGLAIGNPWMDPVLQTKMRLEVGFSLGFLDTKQYNTLIDQYNLLPELVNKQLWREAFDLNQKVKNELIACGGGHRYL